MKSEISIHGDVVGDYAKQGYIESLQSSFRSCGVVFNKIDITLYIYTMSRKYKFYEKDGVYIERFTTFSRHELQTRTSRGDCFILNPRF